MAPAPTLRQQLAQATPRVSLKAAWRAFLQAARQRGRATGVRLVHRDRAALERALDSPGEVEDALLTALKSDLRDLVHGELAEPQRGDLAARIDVCLAAIVPVAATGRVAVEVTGWPTGLDAPTRSALLGEPVSDLDPDAILQLSAQRAASLVAALDGTLLGGRRLSVQVTLPPDTRLPAVPRDERDRSRRTPEPPWLPALDEEGLFSLSSRGLAERHARMLRSLVVHDAFCGCGGDAIAMALAGKHVVAWERDATRAGMARRNASALGARLEVHHAPFPEAPSAHTSHAPLEAALFLDPPWGGRGSAGQLTDWQDLVSLPPSCIGRYPEILLKAPRAFALHSLPTRWHWHCRAWLSSPGADGRCVVAAWSCHGTRDERV